MKVTPEMLLFLAGKMGLERPYFSEGEVAYGVGGYCVFRPATDKAQFADVVLWAVRAGLNPDLDCEVVWTFDRRCYKEEHDNTPAGIMEAIVVAVCRALGWEDV